MGDLQIEKGSGAKPRATFYSDGTPTDLDGACTVTVLKPDGTQLAGSPFSASHVNPTGSGTYEITLGQQTELTYYDVTWAGTIGGVATSVQTRVEVVGGFLFTVAYLRGFQVGGTPNTFQSPTTYPTQTLLDRRTQVTDDFEQRTGYSFIPRFARETFNGNQDAQLILSRMRCQRLLSVTIDGTAQTVGDYILATDGTLQRKTGGTFPDTTPQNVTVEYVYGWDRPPAEISEVAAARAASLLLPSQVGSTVSTWTTPDGVTYQYDQSGQSFGGGRRYYGIPKIDSVLSDPAYNARRGGVFA